MGIILPVEKSMLFKLEKPNLTNKLYLPAIATKKEFLDFMAKYCNGEEYLYWDKFRYKEPMPKGVTKEGLWQIIKFFRRSRSFKTVIKDKNGNFFTWSKLDNFDGFLYTCVADINEPSVNNVDVADRRKFIVNGLIEEAIASSQLEGAATSRAVAKKMLQEGRKPKDASERMIFNNYVAMKAVEEDFKNQAMSIDLILELHGLVTKDTLDSAGEKPHMRKKDDSIYVTSRTNGLIYHEGPGIDFVKKELGTLVKFANDEGQDEVFIHPIVKAIMLHFWIGYLHPFTDGNGRLARTLFYWYLIRKGYVLFAYLPISKVIKKSSQQYLMSYVYSEQDDNDLNYFISYNIKKIILAYQDLAEYVRNQEKETMQINESYAIKYQLNNRQIQLLQYLHINSNEHTTLMTHVNINQITKMTASKDLKDLVKKKLLLMRKQGRNVYYYGTEKIRKLF